MTNDTKLFNPFNGPWPGDPGNAQDALKGDELAKAYASAHPLSLENPGKVWATYDGGGWITLRGEGLKPHPDMVVHYPNGWSLLSRVRSGAARTAIAKAKGQQ